MSENEKNKDFIGRDRTPGGDEEIRMKKALGQAEQALEQAKKALAETDLPSGTVRRMLASLEPVETFAELTDNDPHYSKTTLRAIAVGTVVATTVVEDSIIKGIADLGRKYVLPHAAKTVVTSGWSFGGGVAALAIRAGITGFSGLAGAVIASTLVNLTVDIVQIVKSMPDATVEDEEDDK